MPRMLKSGMKRYHMLNIFENLNIIKNPFTIDGFCKVKCWKTSGPHKIPADVFNYMTLTRTALSSATKTLLENDKPHVWSTMNIILVNMVNTSADLPNTSNCRGSD